MTVSFSPALRPVCACSGSIPECGTLRLAAYPSTYWDDLSAPPFPPPPLPRTPQAMFTASYTPRYARIQHFLAPFSPKVHLADRRTKLCASLFHHFTCHDDALGFVYLWSLKGCTKRQQNQSSATAHGLTTRSAGRAWRSVSRRLFSVLCRRVLCFGSIHSAPSHFVSVNSASSSGLPTSPSPLGEPAWNTTVDRTIYRLATDLSKLIFRGIQKHDVSPPFQPD